MRASSRFGGDVEAYCTHCGERQRFRDEPTLHQTRNLRWQLRGRCDTCGNFIFCFVADGRARAREQGVEFQWDDKPTTPTTSVDGAHHTVRVGAETKLLLRRASALSRHSQREIVEALVNENLESWVSGVLADARDDGALSARKIADLEDQLGMPLDEWTERVNAESGREAEIFARLFRSLFRADSHRPSRE